MWNKYRSCCFGELFGWELIDGVAVHACGSMNEFALARVCVRVWVGCIQLWHECVYEEGDNLLCVSMFTQVCARDALSEDPWKTVSEGGWYSMSAPHRYNDSSIKRMKEVLRWLYLSIHGEPAQEQNIPHFWRQIGAFPASTGIQQPTLERLYYELCCRLFLTL